MLQGLPFHSGGVGVELCLPDVAQPLATVRNRPQPFTTIRNRSREVPMAVPMVSFAKGVTFDISSVASRRFAWQAWHFVTFQHVSCCVKSFLRGRRNAFATFSEGCGAFLWQPQHYGHLHRHFAWQPHHFGRVVFRVFANCIVRAARSGDNVQIRGRRGILSHVMKIDGSLAHNVDFEL